MRFLSPARDFCKFPVSNVRTRGFNISVEAYSPGLGDPIKLLEIVKGSPASNAVRRVAVKAGTANCVFSQEESPAFLEGRRDNSYLPDILFSGRGEPGSHPKECRTIHSRRCEASS